MVRDRSLDGVLVDNLGARKSACRYIIAFLGEAETYSCSAKVENRCSRHAPGGEGAGKDVKLND